MPFVLDFECLSFKSLEEAISCFEAAPAILEAPKDEARKARERGPTKPNKKRLHTLWKTILDAARRAYILGERTQSDPETVNAKLKQFYETFCAGAQVFVTRKYGLALV